MRSNHECKVKKNLIAYPSPLKIAVEKPILWQRNNRIIKCKWSNLIAADNQLRCSTWMKSHIEYFLDSLLNRTHDKAVRPLCLSTSILLCLYIPSCLSTRIELSSDVSCPTVGLRNLTVHHWGNFLQQSSLPNIGCSTILQDI